MSKKLSVVISEETDKKLREVIKTLYGEKRGALSIAIEEAIKEWINKKEKEIKKLNKSSK